MNTKDQKELVKAIETLKKVSSTLKRIGTDNQFYDFNYFGSKIDEVISQDNCEAGLVHLLKMVEG